MSKKRDINKNRAIRDLMAYEDTITVDTEKTVQKIRERARALHAELDRYVSTMLNNLKRTFDSELQRIHRVLDNLKGVGNNSMQRKSVASTFEKSPRHRSTPRSIDFGLNLSQVTDTSESLIDLEQFEKSEVQFIEGESCDELFQKLIGYFTFDISSPISLTARDRSLQATRRSEVKLVKTFKVGDQSETVHAIAPVEEDKAWISCGWGSRSLHLYDKHGHKVKTASLPIQVNDVTTFNDGNEEIVLVSSYKEKSIKRLNQDSLRTTDVAYTSLFPGGLCSDRRNGLYVCFRDGYQRTSTFGARRMVAKLSMHGEIIATMEKTEDQGNIFGYPFRIAVNVNNDVCVADYGDGTRGVIILNREGDVKCRYIGPVGTSKNDQPFLPHGIVCDGNGHILVSDWNNDCVHVLDREGNYLLRLVTKADGVEGPNALGLDKRGYLWVGDSHGVVRTFRYTIFDD